MIDPLKVDLTSTETPGHLSINPFTTSRNVSEGLSPKKNHPFSFGTSKSWCTGDTLRGFFGKRGTNTNGAQIRRLLLPTKTFNNLRKGDVDLLIPSRLHPPSFWYRDPAVTGTYVTKGKSHRLRPLIHTGRLVEIRKSDPKESKPQLPTASPRGHRPDSLSSDTLLERIKTSRLGQGVR